MRLLLTNYPLWAKSDEKYQLGTNNIEKYLIIDDAFQAMRQIQETQINMENNTRISL